MQQTWFWVCNAWNPTNMHCLSANCLRGATTLQCRALSRGISFLCLGPRSPFLCLWQWIWTKSWVTTHWPQQWTEKKRSNFFCLLKRRWMTKSFPWQAWGAPATQEKHVAEPCAALCVAVLGPSQGQKLQPNCMWWHMRLLQLEEDSWPIYAWGFVQNITASLSGSFTRDLALCGQLSHVYWRQQCEAANGIFSWLVFGGWLEKNSLFLCQFRV